MRHTRQHHKTVLSFFVADFKYSTLQSPFVGYFYFVDFQIFSTLQSKILNILTNFNYKNLHTAKFICNFVT